MLVYLTTLLLVASTTVYSKPAPEPPSSYFPPSSGGASFSSGSGSYGPPSLPDRYGPPQQQPVVHKHVYVHVPPPEAPEYKPPKYIPPAAPPQKHYKIVFIKAPTPPTPTAPALPPLPPQDEEKTLIYVLVKKPEEAPEVVLPTQAPTQPSKPEVYFIRYKTQKEQQNAEYGPPPQSLPSDNYGAPPSSSGGPY
ncbi:leucine-rich repeat extensin-like protein 3 [Frieseomelitta varia]|uniref:leucine-rich repeat extensin-like protein 3 n=1 Tax=Frieseomelitta varia TaxID=561572 RepID=UPI001CB68048|nr:leucine-rich repeat extensin-like protein 3 [Frieseomelitta varia]